MVVEMKPSKEVSALIGLRGSPSLPWVRLGRAGSSEVPTSAELHFAL